MRDRIIARRAFCGLAAGIAAAFAGCGGLGLIITSGPWPPTHGWFAMFSGLALWPVTAWASKKYLKVELSGRVRLGVAAFILLAGRLAVDFVWPGQAANRTDRVAIVCGAVLLITILSGRRRHR